MYKKKIIVCYLFTGFDKITSFNNFIRHYKKYKSGYKHSLLICYKLLKEKKIKILEKKITDLNHQVFIDPIENDWISCSSVKRKIKNIRYCYFYE